MTKSVCRICKKSNIEIFSTLLLKKHKAKFFNCLYCGYVQTETPFWTKEAYKDSINQSDTGLIMRNLWLKNVAASIIYFFFDNKGSFLDYGGGYGIFVRLMRDIGFNFYWQDEHTENLFAKGFELTKSGILSFELITCFEAFEHFVEPIIELDKLLSMSRTILISTELIPSPTPQPSEWWYYGVEHGQHIGFFRRKTFEYLAYEKKLNFYTNDQNIHLLTNKNISTNTFFKLITKVSKYTSPLFQKRMTSLTWKDMERLKDITL